MFGHTSLSYTSLSSQCSLLSFPVAMHTIVTLLIPTNTKKYNFFIAYHNLVTELLQQCYFFFFLKVLINLRDSRQMFDEMLQKGLFLVEYCIQWRSEAYSGRHQTTLGFSKKTGSTMVIKIAIWIVGSNDSTTQIGACDQNHAQDWDQIGSEVESAGSVKIGQNRDY